MCLNRVGLGFDLKRIEFELEGYNTQIDQSEQKLLYPSSALIRIDNKPRDEWRFAIYYWKVRNVLLTK
jgi:hypothetical protein